MSLQLKTVTKLIIAIAVLFPLLFHGYFFWYKKAEELSPRKLRSLIESDQSCLLVDVRPKAFFDDDHVKGAHWWSLRDILALQTKNDIPRQFRDKRLFCICSIGVQSQVAALKLKSLGQEATNVRGGMALWHSEPAMFASSMTSQLGTFVRFLAAPALLVLSLIFWWRKVLPTFPLLTLTFGAIALTVDTTVFSALADGFYYVFVICQSLTLSWLIYHLLEQKKSKVTISIFLAALLPLYLLLNARPRAIGTLSSLLDSRSPWTFSILRQNFSTTYLGCHGLLLIVLSLLALCWERSCGPYFRLFLAGAAGPIYWGLVSLLVTTLLAQKPSLLLFCQHILAIGHPLLILLCWRKCVSCSPTNKDN